MANPADTAWQPTPLRKLCSVSIERIAHAGDLAVLHAVRRGEYIETGTGAAGVRHLLSVDKNRSGLEPVRNGRRLLAHPGERNIREARLRLRIGAPDVGVVSGEPKLDEPRMAWNMRQRGRRAACSRPCAAHPALVRRKPLRRRGLLSGAGVAPLGYCAHLDVRAGDVRSRPAQDPSD